MAKKNQPAKEPTISEIPIPASDNPMVIDLPDGQKIVLNKLAPGSVIEVATWRGTGRPDSRTNRFMLGVSDSSAPQPNSHSSKVSQSPTGKKLTLPWLVSKIKEEEKKAGIAGVATRLLSQLFSPIIKGIKRTQDLAPEESTTDLEINAWLENLSREVKSEIKAPVAPRRLPAKKATPKNKVLPPTKNKGK